MHVEPILLPIAGLYRLFPGVETLLILQATVVALGAIPIFALARHLRLGAWLALALAVAYLLNPTIQAANWLEFHPVTLAPTFLMAAFYFLVARTPRSTAWFVLFAVLAASCKEEMGLLVAMLGVYAALIQRRWGFGLLTFVLAAGWSLLAVLVIQATFAGGNIHWGRYAYLGDTTQAKLFSLITRPDLIFAQLQTANIGRYFFELLLPVGFLSVLAPEVLFLALPSLAINLLAQFSPMHQVTTLIYAAPILPFVMLSAVQGAARLLGWLTRGRAARPAVPHSSVPAAVLGVWVVGAALLGQFLYGYLPFGGNNMPLEVSDHHRRGQAFLAQIPAGAAVAAQDRLNPHVAGRETVYIFPRVDDADYVLLDVTGSAWPQHPNDLKQSVSDLLENGFGIAAAEDGYLLLQRGADQQTPTPEFYSAWQGDEPLAQPIASGAEFGGLLRLDEYQVRSDRYGELVVDMHWTALEPLDEDLRFYIAYIESKGQALQDSIYYQPVSVLWYPTSMWPQGERTFVQSLPWDLGADEFVLGVGIYRGEEGWSSGARIPVTASGSQPVLENGTLLRLGGFERTGEDHWQPQAPLPQLFADLPPLQPVEASFGNAVQLLGAGRHDVARRSESMPLHLQWRRTATAPPNLSRFVHVLDSGGENVAQVDGAIADALGALPLESWPEQKPVDDLMTINLPAKLTPGDYTLVAGLYDWQTGERLAATGAAARPDGAVQLGTIRITE
jgi:uncharacterized membrane protein